MTLSKVKEALENIVATKNMTWAEKERRTLNCELAKEALTELNAYIARLESSGLVEEKARQLDHAGMDKLLKENEQLKYWLGNCHKLLHPNETTADAVKVK